MSCSISVGVWHIQALQSGRGLHGLPAVHGTEGEISIVDVGFR